MKSQHISPYLPADVISVGQLDSCSILCGKSRPFSVIGVIVRVHAKTLALGIDILIGALAVCVMIGRMMKK